MYAWLSKALSFRFVAVENTGSLARDALANERTYLAWLRTAVTAISVGVVLSGIDSGRLTTATSVLFIVLGLFCLLYGVPRYYHTAALLDKDRFAPDTLGPGIIGVLSVATGFLSLAFVIQRT